MDEDRFENDYMKEPSLDDLLRDAHEVLNEPQKDPFADDIGYPEYSGKPAEFLPEDEPDILSDSVFREAEPFLYEDVPSEMPNDVGSDFEDASTVRQDFAVPGFEEVSSPVQVDAEPSDVDVSSSVQDVVASGFEDIPSALQNYAEPDYEELPTAQERAAEAFEPDFGDAFEDFGEYDETYIEQEPQPTRRHLKRVRFPKLVFVAIWFAVVFGLSILAANFIWSCVDDAAALTRPDQDVEIVINDGDDLDTVANTLKEAGAIEKEWLFKLYCRVTHKENFYDPGVYNINLIYDYHALVNNLMASSGNRETTEVMIMEGLDCYEIFDLLEENGVCTRAALEQAAANSEFDYAFLADRPYGETNRLEGYLFPDTYQFYLNDEPENVLEKLLDNFDKKMDEDVMALVEASGYSLHEVLAMASIIEGEAANDKERADVASVMYNRIRNWDYPLLGMDSTVNYAAKLLGVDFSTSIDSPYNTYRYPGLPAGPINNPGMNSIMAALQPNNTDYYYFATAKDGLNRFFKDEGPFNEFINSDEYIGNASETTDD